MRPADARTAEAGPAFQASPPASRQAPTHLGHADQGGSPAGSPARRPETRRDVAPAGRGAASGDDADEIPAEGAHGFDEDEYEDEYEGGAEADGDWGAPGADHAAGGPERGWSSDPAGAPPARPARGRMASLMLVVAGLAAAGAALAPWSTLATSDEERTFTGLTVGDGRFTVVLGLALAVLGGAGLARRRLSGDGALGPLLASLLIVIAGSDLLIGPPTLASFRGISADQIVVEPEAGLYASLAAGVLALMAALVPRRGAQVDGARVDGARVDGSADLPAPPSPRRADARHRPETPAFRQSGDHRANRAR
ncbi:hypothetical protein [Pseudofrankia sp. BMG5.36]|uniref:hypothetical protein n=1 Tax=Pseudofrankia sp. BMG5.36 TaxID=1834512 RepID=UPI0008DA1315|nr:hypothetical protein [Pseudofrankia sp. BMG5.36]OHV69206.1 hypothetical protein BCD48_35005 [Pseudofrankia sp. BMG5.36]